MGSVAKEYPKWRIRVADLPARAPWPPVEQLRQLPSDQGGQAWAYRHGQWYRPKLLPTQLPAASRSAYSPGGVYVVVGGAGGIGTAWSEYMIRTYQAQILWLGRRPLDEPIRQKLAQLAQWGPAPRYWQADATDRDSLERAYRQIKQSYAQIDGVVHSAIVLLDKSLANMSEESFRAALAAKVDASVQVGEVFGAEPLQWVLFFSSLQSFTRSAGQSNYAAGCTFADAYAQALGAQAAYPVKVMNWGYWGSIGVVSSAEHRERMARVGLGSIEVAEGMAGLESLLASPRQQIALLKTTQPLGAAQGVGEESLRVYPQEHPSLMAAWRERATVIPLTPAPELPDQPIDSLDQFYPHVRQAR
jgi:polyketide synthase PksM